MTATLVAPADGATVVSLRGVCRASATTSCSTGSTWTSRRRVRRAAGPLRLRQDDAAARARRAGPRRHRRACGPAPRPPSSSRIRGCCRGGACSERRARAARRRPGAAGAARARRGRPRGPRGRLAAAALGRPAPARRARPRARARARPDAARRAVQRARRAHPRVRPGAGQRPLAAPPARRAAGHPRRRGVAAARRPRAADRRTAASPTTSASTSTARGAATTPSWSPAGASCSSGSASTTTADPRKEPTVKRPCSRPPPLLAVALAVPAAGCGVETRGGPRRRQARQLARGRDAPRRRPEGRHPLDPRAVRPA